MKITFMIESKIWVSLTRHLASSRLIITITQGMNDWDGEFALGDIFTETPYLRMLKFTKLFSLFFVIPLCISGAISLTFSDIRQQ